MSDTDGRPRGRPPHRHSKHEVAQPGDEQFTYSRKQLIRFDNRFRSRLLRAFRRGLEHEASAAADVFITTDTPFALVTARRRASQYRDLANVTASVP